LDAESGLLEAEMARSTPWIRLFVLGQEVN